MTKKKSYKHKPSSSPLKVLVTVLILILASAGILGLVIQAGLISWWQPTPINLALATGPTISECSTTPYPSPECSSITGTSQQHVADTWQLWTITYQDGSTETRTSSVQGLNLRLALVNLNTIRSIEIQIPVELTATLSTGTIVVVQPSLGISVNSQNPISFSPNWWGQFTFMAGRDFAGATQTYDIFLLLTGAMQSPGSKTVDLRSQIASLALSQFNIAVTIAEVWTAYVQYAGYGLLPTDNKVVPVAYAVDFNVDLTQFSGTFTVPLPTQTVTTCQGGVCVQIPATTFTTSAPGVTATVRGNGTTFTLTTTFTNPWKLPSACDLFGVPWLCDKTFGILNWIWLILGFILFLTIIAYTLRKKKS